MLGMSLDFPTVVIVIVGALLAGFTTASLVSALDLLHRASGCMHCQRRWSLHWSRWLPWRLSWSASSRFEKRSTGHEPRRISPVA